MFDIDELKEMKLLELQEIAQKIEVPKFRQLKKLDLVYQILDVQASNPKQVKEKAGSVQKTKRKRISKPEDSSNPQPMAKQETKETEKKEEKKTSSQTGRDSNAPQQAPKSQENP